MYPGAADCTCVAAVVNNAVGASKNHLGLLNNGGQFPLEVWRVEVISHLASANTGSATTFYLLRTTAAGTGTVATVRRTNNRGRPVPASVSALHTYTVQPTVTANSELAGQTVYSEETTGQTSKEPLFQADPARGVHPVVLWPGEGVVVQQSALASAGAVSVFVYFRVRDGRAG